LKHVWGQFNRCEMPGPRRVDTGPNTGVLDGEWTREWWVESDQRARRGTGVSESYSATRRRQDIGCSEGCT
jgi:hypothetical protein